MLLHGYSDRLSKGLNRPDALRSEQEYWKTMEPYPPPTPVRNRTHGAGHRRSEEECNVMDAIRKEEVIQRLTDHRQKLAQFGVKSPALFSSLVRDEARQPAM